MDTKDEKETRERREGGKDMFRIHREIGNGNQEVEKVKSEAMRGIYFEGNAGGEKRERSQGKTQRVKEREGKNV